MNRRSLLVVAAAALAGTLIFRSSLAAEDFPAGSPAFETDYKTALAAAAKSGKPLIVVFSATWCAPCKVNKKKVYPSAKVKPYHDKFIWAYLDMDAEANVKPAQQFGVSIIPHVQFLTKGGKAFDKLVEATTPEAFVKKMDAVLAAAK